MNFATNFGFVPDAGCCGSAVTGKRSARFGRAFTAAAILAGAAALAACSTSGSYPHDTTENFSVAKYGPAADRVVDAGAKVPKGGGHYMVGEPYRIAGKTYIPRDDPKYSQVGIASWYGWDFHGRETANGEIYDLDAVTAAHPTMPLPSYARVTNLDNGRSVTVRVNDRGPFVENRIIDVSRTVARMLDFEDAGTAKVKVEYVGPATLDGNDQKMLAASYRGPGVAPATVIDFPVRVASAQPQAPVAAPAKPAAPTTSPLRAPQAAQPATLTIAAASPTPALRPAPAKISDGSAPLTIRSSLATSYAAPVALTPAEEAAATLGRPDLSAQLKLAAAKKAAELGLPNPPTR